MKKCNVREVVVVVVVVVVPSPEAVAVVVVVVVGVVPSLRPLGLRDEEMQCVGRKSMLITLKNKLRKR